MKRIIENIFIRNNIYSSPEIIKWWLNGLGFLNLFFFLYVVFHLTIILFVFNNGFVFFLLPIIFAIGIIVNILYLSGLLTEIIISKAFKLKVDFDKISPIMKEWLIIISIFFVILCSAFNIINQ
jgi:hypothetical protein